MLFKIVKDFFVKIVLIVFFLKVVKVILKFWDKYDNIVLDFVVIEGLKVGGYLGYKLDEL